MSVERWQLMRRALDRNILIASCATREEADLALRAAQRAEPDLNHWIDAPDDAERQPARRRRRRDVVAWIVMRRAGERNVRVATSATEREATALLQATLREHPNEDAWIEEDDTDATSSAPERAAEPVPHDTWIDHTPARIPEARVVSPLERPKSRDVPWFKLFWRGSRVVELSKAGSRIDENGQVRWDAKPHRYPAETWWPRSAIVAGAVIIGMVVMLVIALS
jgi:hypothetical protein